MYNTFPNSKMSELYVKFRPIINRMVKKKGGIEADAEDILQKSFLALWKKLKAGNIILEKGPDAYFYTICRNNCKRGIGKNSLTELNKHVSDNIIENDFTLKEESMLQQKRIALFELKLAELGPRSNEMLLLCWSGKSNNEIALILKLAPSYVRRKICTSKKRLTCLVKKSPEFTSLK